MGVAKTRRFLATAKGKRYRVALKKGEKYRDGAAWQTAKTAGVPPELREAVVLAARFRRYIKRVANEA